MGHGGPRPGSGRKKGSGNRIKISDYLSDEQVADLVYDAIEKAKTSEKIHVFLLEQLAGKAPQRLEHTGDEGQAITFVIAKEIAQKNELARESKNNS
jgi:hypothetical protein